jgi:uncharacterized membrane protein
MVIAYVLRKYSNYLSAPSFPATHVHFGWYQLSYSWISNFVLLCCIVLVLITIIVMMLVCSALLKDPCCCFYFAIISFNYIIVPLKY